MSFGDYGPKSGTFHRKLTGTHVPAPLIKEELMVAVPNLVRAIPKSAKVIAFRTGTTPRCIEGIRGGEHLPSLPVALALARECPDMRELLTQFMDAETGDGPRGPDHVLNEIQRLLQERLK